MLGLGPLRLSRHYYKRQSEEILKEFPDLLPLPFKPQRVSAPFSYDGSFISLGVISDVTDRCRCDFKRRGDLKVNKTELLCKQ